MGASSQELQELGDMFDLHPLTVEEMVCGSSRDRIDTFGDYTFIVYRTLANSKRQRCKCGEENCSLFVCEKAFADSTSLGHLPSMEDTSREGQVCIVMKSNCVLTVHRDYVQQEAVSRVLQRLAAIRSAAADIPMDGAELYDNEESLAGLLDYPPYIVYAILDEITDQLSPEIAEIEQQVDAIDELVLGLSHAQHESALKRMGEQRRRILLAWQLAHPKPRIIEALVRQIPVYCGSPRLASEVMQYLGDVHGHLVGAVDSCTRAEAVLARSHSNYLAKISLELSRATFDANSTTERWTMLGIIVVPINIVTSFLGVNLKVPGQDRDDTLNFFIVLACLLIYAAVTLAFWRWRQLT
ncbi:CorA metal ion transporter [Coemansia spiralis]|uniref:CorA metal ion transporter n=1 Tax=Coemansia spiralis TaxID=417178 RepID=A0A9W8GQA2_9FUNG|nr:CorA metal ion transporter [Coemansia spiralis]